MCRPDLDLSIGTRTVIRMRQRLSLSTMEPTLVTGIAREIERDVAARGNGTGIGTGMIKMIKTTTGSHERGERVRVMMGEKGRRSGDDGASAVHLLCILYHSSADRRLAPDGAFIIRLTFGGAR